MNKIKELFYYLLPILYISWIFYVRLIAERLPRDIFPVTVKQVLITVFIMTLILLRIYFLLVNEEIIKVKPLKNPILLKIRLGLSKINAFIDTAWFHFFLFLSENFLYFNFFLLFLAKKLKKYLSYSAVLSIIIIFEVLPKLIIVSAFLIDILIFGKFYYFYKVLILLLLPLIFSSIRAMLLQFYVNNYQGLASYLTKTEKDGLYHYSFREDFTPPPFITDLEDFMINHFIPIYDIKSILLFYAVTRKYFKIDILLIFILMLHFLGWSFILVKGIIL